eukprot:762947-Hanusia_phi.AAC.14
MTKLLSAEDGDGLLDLVVRVKEGGARGLGVRAESLAELDLAGLLALLGSLPDASGSLRLEHLLLGLSDKVLGLLGALELQESHDRRTHDVENNRSSSNDT